MATRRLPPHRTLTHHTLPGPLELLRRVKLLLNTQHQPLDEILPREPLHLPILGLPPHPHLLLELHTLSLLLLLDLAAHSLRSGLVGAVWVSALQWGALEGPLGARETVFLSVFALFRAVTSFALGTGGELVFEVGSAFVPEPGSAPTASATLSYVLETHS